MLKPRAHVFVYCVIDPSRLPRTPVGAKLFLSPYGNLRLSGRLESAARIPKSNVVVVDQRGSVMEQPKGRA